MPSSGPSRVRPQIPRPLALAVLGAVASLLVAGCQFVPPQLLGGELIVLEVANHAGRPASLVVAAPGNIGEVMGSVDPAVVPPGQTITVRFFVPPSGEWAIWANGGELMGKHDVGAKRGNVPMGIDIGRDGQPGWWCNADCP
jgi:hypothetical protein